jgi:hypothetical protein
MLAGSFATNIELQPGPIDLEAALQDLAEERGVKFVNFHRIGTHGGRLSIRTSQMYYMLTALAPSNLQDRDKVDDVIYDDLNDQLASLS